MGDEGEVEKDEEEDAQEETEQVDETGEVKEIDEDLAGLDEEEDGPPGEGADPLPEAPLGDDSDESDDEGVQEHLKDAVEGTLRVKRLLSEDLEEVTNSNAGSARKKRKLLENRAGPAEQAKIRQIMIKWGLADDAVTKHVLEGLTLQELKSLDETNYVPDKFNMWKSPAELVAMHAAQMRERLGPGGGPLDGVSAFKHRWKLDIAQEQTLRKLTHKELRYVVKVFDKTRPLEEVIEEAKKSSPEEGTAQGAAPDAPGPKAFGRFHRLELIDPMADCAVFGDANLTFSLNLAKHRKALGHVGRIIATTFEPLETLRERYKEIDETIRILEEHYAEVHHEVDCTRIAVDPKFKGMEESLGAVYYNFPHAGAVSGFFDGHPLVNWRHENLMRLFFRALRSFVKPGGIVKVASNMGAVGVRYSYIIRSGMDNEFIHVETVPFLEWQLHRYGRSYGDRRDAYKRPGEGQGYNVQRAEADMVYTFVYQPSGATLPPQEIRFPPTFKTIQACPDGPFQNLQGESRKHLAKQLAARFLTECSGTHVG